MMRVGTKPEPGREEALGSSIHYLLLLKCAKENTSWFLGGNQIFAVLEHFSTNSELCWLLLSVLESSEKENNEPRPLNSQPKIWERDQKLSLTAMEETFISCSLRVKISDNKTLSFHLAGNWISLQIEFITKQGLM